MPTRILRDWCDSEPVNAVSVQAERFYIRLIMKADDFARQTANPKLLRPLLFPLLLDEVREADVQRWIAECVKSGLVRLYEVDSKSYLEIIKFRQIPRAKASKFPSPPVDAEHMQCERSADVLQMRPYSDSNSDSSLSYSDSGEREKSEAAKSGKQSSPSALDLIKETMSKPKTGGRR